MKKFLFAVSLILAVCFVFISCGEDNGDKAETDFSITAESSSDYSVEIKDKAKENEIITFTVKLLNANKEIKSVSYMCDSVKTACSKSETGYSFTMPGKDVAIVVDLSSLEEIATDRALSWDTVYTSVAKCNNEDSYLPSWHNTNFRFSLDKSSFCSQAEITVTSSNTSVIPQNAITYETSTESGSNVINGGHISIDSRYINIGDSFITVTFKNNNNLNSYTIVKKITVCEYGSVSEIVFENVKINFNIDGVNKNGNEIRYIINDLDGQYGSNNTGDFSDTLTDSGVLTFNLIKGHRYSVSIQSNKEDLKINDNIISGNSTTGFNGLQKGIIILNFYENSQEISIIASEK